MTSAVEQAGNEHPVGFYPHRDAHLSQTHSSQLWYRTKAHSEGIAIIPSMAGPMGVSTPPPIHPRGVLKLGMCAGSQKEMKHDLPHWMDSKRGVTQPAARLEIPAEAGPSTPMKCPPKQLTELPASVRAFSSPAKSHVALFEPRSKVTWARQEKASVLPASANYSMIVTTPSSRRGDDQSGFHADSFHVQKESQKENVMSLKELQSALQMLSSSKVGAPSSTGSSPIGQPASIRALATLAESKSKTTLPDDSILQLHLRHEPCSRSPVTSPEKHAGDPPVHNDVVGCGSTSDGVKQDIQNKARRGKDCDGWRVTRPGSKPSTDELCHPHTHESAKSAISSTRLRRQATLESDSSLNVHADLSLGLQSATESTHHAMWHDSQSPPKLLAQKWSEIHSPRVSTRTLVNSSQCRSTNSTPSAPQTPAVSLSLFTPSVIIAREEPREQSRTDDEKIGGLNDGTTAFGKKRKNFRKAHKTADYSPGPSSSIELNHPAEYAGIRDQIRKRVKREAPEMAPGIDLESKEEHDVGTTPFQLWLQTSATVSHPYKHDFFPDKPKYAEAAVPSASGDSSIRKARICGTSSPSLFEDSIEFPREGVIFENGVVNENAAAGDTRANTGHHLAPHFTPVQLSVTTDMLEETQLGLGRRSSTISSSLADSIRNLPTVVRQSGEQGEETSTTEASWQQRAKLFAVPAHAPMPIGHPTFSAGEPSLPLSLSCCSEPVRNPPHTKCTQATTPKPEEEWGKSLALCATPLPAVPPQQSPSAPSLNYQERFVLLQAYLKHCDEVVMSHQNMQALMQLSPAARSGFAVDLETKAMWLSIEEGLEMKRLNSINVMGWNQSNGPQPYQGEDGATPRGRRIPVPGEVRPSPSFFSQTRVHQGMLPVGHTPST